MKITVTQVGEQAVVEIDTAGATIIDQASSANDRKLRVLCREAIAQAQPNNHNANAMIPSDLWQTLSAIEALLQELEAT